MKCHKVFESISEALYSPSEAVELIWEVVEGSAETIESDPEAVALISERLARFSEAVAALSELIEHGSEALELDSEVSRSFSAGFERFRSAGTQKIFGRAARISATFRRKSLLAREKRSRYPGEKCLGAPHSVRWGCWQNGRRHE